MISRLQQDCIFAAFMTHTLIVFASGKGTNAAAIIDYFKRHPIARVGLIVCNNPDAGVIAIARKEHISFLIVDKETFHERLLISQLQEYRPSLIVLAGFLWKIPERIIRVFRSRIINIHPALLPAFGGKGMYGNRVHEAVLSAGEKESGITIHQVNEKYDEGRILLQARCPVQRHDTPDSLAQRIHKLEHFYFPRTLRYILEHHPDTI